MSKRKLILDIDKCIECPCLETYEDWLGMLSGARCRLIDKKINIVEAQDNINKDCLLEEEEENV